MALSAHAVVGACATQRHALVDRHIVADLGGFADDHEPVIDEEIAPDRRAGMNVDRGGEAREMVDRARQEIEPGAKQPVRDAVIAERPDAGIQQNLPPRARRRIASLDRIEIGGQPGKHR